MKFSKLLFIYFLIIGCNSYSQKKIAVNEVLQDITFLNDVLINAHAVNYNYQVPTLDLNNIINDLDNIQVDSLSKIEFNSILNRALFQFECIHTSITKNPLGISSKKETKYFPFEMLIFHDDLYLVTEDSIVEKVIRINDINASEILEWILYFRGCDGGSYELSLEFFNKYAQIITSQYFNFADQYSIETNQRLIEKKSILTPSLKSNLENKHQKIISNDDNYLAIIDNVAYLKIKSFSSSDKRFFKKVFKNIHNYDNLIIDVRDNPGGDRHSGVYLTRNLVDTTFTYSILDPKLQQFKYLDGKGKFYYLLSKLKYNIGNIFRAEKHPMGKNFVYKYNPLKKIYQGDVFVLTNGFTASTSTMLTSWLKQHTPSTFIGTQAGGGYNGNNGGSFPTITLPYSRVQIKVPIYRIILDENSLNTAGIIPEENPIQNKLQLISPGDITLDYTLQLIRSHKN